MSSNAASSTSITLRESDPDWARGRGVRGVYNRYPENHSPVFDAIVFDETRLAQQNLISGHAVAGRGNTFFLTFEGCSLVLRHYRRGGLVQRVSSSRYIFTGLARTRAMLEFDILLKMHDMQLPVPKPFACRVVKYCCTYEASIVTHRLAGKTLAQRFLSATMTDGQWREIGKTIARFHQERIYHADLNAHNILLSDEGLVSLIDFDRAEIRPMSAHPSDETWCTSNLDRLQRSLEKLAKNPTGALVDIASRNLPLEITTGFPLLRSSWFNALA